jgi:integrase
MTYPKPWKSTGSGSYRELRPGVFLLNWRPYGTRGPRKQRTVSCSEKEAKDFLRNQATQRSREPLDIPTATTWQSTIDLYRARLQAKGDSEDYITKTMALVESISDHCGLADVAAIRARHVQAWIDTLAYQARKNERPGWARNANKKLSMIGGFFRYLARKRHIQADPMMATDRFPEPKTLKRQLTPDEYAAVWKVSEPSIRDLMDFLLLTGARVGEVEGLKHSHITEAGVWKIAERKAKDELAMPLTPELLEIVKRQDPHPDGYVFSKRVGVLPTTGKGHGLQLGGPIQEKWLLAVLKQRAALAGVREFRIHDLRHAASTWAVNAGVSMWFVKGFLGHSNIQTTHKYTDAHNAGGTNVVQKAILQERDKAFKALKINELAG